MGKISPQSIKYLINAKFAANGVVEKPDLIGAIFGQTEGLLGDELDLRKLQKAGKIGRINAILEVNESKTEGKIEIPTSMDKAETALIGAAIETIDRIGPCEASFEILSIEDVRNSKREYIVERAKQLLASLNGPKLKELEQDVIARFQSSKVIEYGREMLPAGPKVEEADELIVVEGRADVINLVQCGIENVIGMNGTVVPETIKELSKEKEITLFVDGDRGGLLIALDALKNAEIAWIARAPDGKEVEELTEKEIRACLRARLSPDEFKAKFKLSDVDGYAKFKNYLQELEGTGAAYLLIDKNRLKKVNQLQLLKTLKGLRKQGNSIYALILDGLATLPLVREAERLNCKYLVAKNFSATSNQIKMLSF